MAPPRERNDRRPAWNPAQGSGAGRGGEKPWRGPPRLPKRETSHDWLWGRHAVEAALVNPARPQPKRVLAIEERARALQALAPGLAVQVVEPTAIAAMLPTGAAHQGQALETPELAGVDLDALAEPTDGLLLMLDQVTDPQNVGAIFRSAAAFGARGVILQDRRSPPLAGALAKAAAGAIERVPCARVVNLARALESLSDLGWRAVGLAGEAQADLAQVLDPRPTVLVLGSEGEGLRRLVAEHCDGMARIPMPGGFESLNVASAAAVALYEASRRTSVRAAGESD